MLAIIHEDDEILVVDKPADLVCHPSKAGELSSLVGRIRIHLGHGEGRLVNRLDRETSGVVLIAKSALVARELGKLMAADGKVEKVYDAIVHGGLTGPVTIDAPLGRDEASPVAIKDRVRPEGAPARTDVRPVAVIERPDGTFTQVEVRPRTGRKHQIRIHLAHIGHAIVGDKIYGADDRIYLRFVTGTMTPADAAVLILPNHALHARRMAFEWRGRVWEFEAPPTEAFAAFGGTGRGPGVPGPGS